MGLVSVLGLIKTTTFHTTNKFYTKVKDSSSLAVVVLHRIWLRRNKLIFEGLFLPPLKVCLEASHLLEDFKKCNLRKPLSSASSDVSSLSCTFWDPLRLGL